MSAVSGADLNQVSADLADHMVVEKRELLEKLRTPSETEALMSTVTGVKDKYISYTGTVGQTLQPYQPDWTPVGGEGIKPMVAQVYMLKVDKEFKNFEQLFQTYTGWLATEGIDMEEYPIAKWIINQLFKEAALEIEMNCATAKYVAPTAGTAGATSTMFDGFITIRNKEITNGNIVPIGSGAFVPADIYSNFSYFIKQIPPHALRRLIMQKRPFLMSDTNAEHLWEDFRDENKLASDYTRTIHADGSFEIFVGTKKVRIKGLQSMEGTDAFIGTEKDNFKRMYDRTVLPNMFRIGYLKRVLYIEALLKRGYAYDKGLEVYTNDLSLT